jgi:hypothetical protein
MSSICPHSHGCPWHLSVVSSDGWSGTVASLPVQVTAQQAPEHAQVSRVSEAEPIKLLRAKPADGVVLFWLQVRDSAPPAARDPHGEIEAGLRIDPAQHRVTLNALKLSPQLLGHLPPECTLRILTWPEVTAREVPHVRIPPPPWRPVTQQHLVHPTQDHGNDAVIFHGSSMSVAAQELSDGALASENPQ